SAFGHGVSRPVPAGLRRTTGTCPALSSPHRTWDTVFRSSRDCNGTGTDFAIMTSLGEPQQGRPTLASGVSRWCAAENRESPGATTQGACLMLQQSDSIAAAVRLFR